MSTPLRSRLGNARIGSARIGNARIGNARILANSGVHSHEIWRSRLLVADVLHFGSGEVADDEILAHFVDDDFVGLAGLGGVEL